MHALCMRSYSKRFSFNLSVFVFFFIFANAGAIVRKSSEHKENNNNKCGRDGVFKSERMRVQRSDIRKITHIDMYNSSVEYLLYGLLVSHLLHQICASKYFCWRGKKNFLLKKKKIRLFCLRFNTIPCCNIIYNYMHKHIKCIFAFFISFYFSRIIFLSFGFYILRYKRKSMLFENGNG